MATLKAADTAQASVFPGRRAAAMASTAAGKAARPATAPSCNHRGDARRNEPGRVQGGHRWIKALEGAEPGTAVAERGRRVRDAQRRARHAQIISITLSEGLEEHGDSGRLQDRGRVTTPGNEGRLVRLYQGRQREGRVRELGQGAPGGLQAVKISIGDDELLEL